VEVVADVAKKVYRQRLVDFLTKLLNNNDTRYFYFHDDPSLGPVEPHVAFLHLSIAIRSRDHYETCLKARKCSLDDTFQAKLGWLVGNLYSRVGTKDWVPNVEDKAAFDRRLGQLADSVAKWMPDKKVDLVVKKYRDTVGPIPSADGIRSEINAAQVETRRERVLKSVKQALQEPTLLGEKVLTPTEIASVERYLASMSQFKAATEG